MENNSPISKLFASFDTTLISKERKAELQSLVDLFQEKINNKEELSLVYVCTHNSRRSQFAQVWSQVASEFYKIPAHSYSAGTEVTEANPRTIKALKNMGFSIEKEGNENPIYKVKTTNSSLKLFSKDLSHNSLPHKFIALMTCSHADENCPFIPHCEARIPMRFEDPKEFDDTEFETQKYLEKSVEIGTEINYVFSSLTPAP